MQSAGGSLWNVLLNSTGRALHQDSGGKKVHRGNTVHQQQQYSAAAAATQCSNTVHQLQEEEQVALVTHDRHPTLQLCTLHFALCTAANLLVNC